MTLPVRLRLENFGLLSLGDKQALSDAVTRTHELDPDQDLVSEGKPSANCHIVLEGMLCRYKLHPDGNRQILGFHIAGDLCDLSGLPMTRLDFSVGALTQAKLAVIPRAELMRLIEERPSLGFALWQEAAVEAAIARSWIVNVGHRLAPERCAHLFCEMGRRMQAAGLAKNGSFSWPISQTVLGDAVGLSTVHVNRSMQRLRGDGLIITEGQTIRVPDWQRLEAAGEFSPDYLFLSASTQQPMRTK